MQYHALVHYADLKWVKVLLSQRVAYVYHALRGFHH